MWDESAAASGSQGIFLQLMSGRRGDRVHLCCCCFAVCLQPVCCRIFQVLAQGRMGGGGGALECCANEDISYVLRSFEKNTHSVH